MTAYKEMLAKAKYRLRGHLPETIGTGIEQMKNGDLGALPDIYGTGAIIEDFQELISKELGKEQSVFFPSGTMAQQIALRIWSEEKCLKRVAYHPLCHLEIHEKDGLKVLHQIKSVLLGEPDRLFTLEDLRKMKEPVSCVLFELPQRELGGLLPEWEELVAMTSYCREHDIFTHLDGARLMEVLPFYGKTAAEVCRLFDSVYISFYKTFGGITGAMLSGKKDFIDQSKVWKRRHGGDLHHLYPYIISSRYCYELRKDKMAEYWEGAKAYGEMLGSLPGVRIVPKVPVCNMFHVHFEYPVSRVERALMQVMKKNDLALFGAITAIDLSRSKSEIWIGDSFSLVDETLVRQGIELLEEELKRE